VNIRLTTAAALTTWIALLAGGLLGCEATGGGFTLGSRTSGDEDVWAIRCITFNGPDRFQRAEQYAQALRNVPELKDDLVQVVSDEESSAVFYGRYQRRYDTATDEAQYSPNHLPDLERIRSLQFSGSNVWPFILASMDVLPTYRTSSPEWDLNNAEGFWALHVAVFYNTEEFRSRRSAAEEYCRILREQGEEAYFHHGAGRSSVYVGTYPKGAVAEVQQENAYTGTVRAQLRIVDPEMIAAQERFPVSLHNGHKRFEILRDPVTNEETARVPTQSFPVLMPGASLADLDRRR
jgi:hypothetical protein